MAPGLGYGSSGYSTGFLRAYYSFDETMHLALDGIDAYHNWGEVLHLNDISSTPPLDSLQAQQQCWVQRLLL
jgi:hypothetical protein